MNELRMYVEHLFEGRVLTTEMIELKEEIYGNLVARYEDYLAEGMDGAEALEKTKASMTNIDDVLEENSDGVAATMEPAGDSGEAPCEADALSKSVHESPGTEEEGAAFPDAPVPQDMDAIGAEATHCDGKADTPARPSRMKWSRAALGVSAAILLLGLGFQAARVWMSFTDPGDIEHIESSGGGAGVASGDGAPIKSGDDSIVFDANGGVSYDGEPADDLLLSVVNSPSGDVKPYVDTDLSDATKVEALVRALPMHEYACDIDTTKGVDRLGLAYRELPETVEGDSVDVALAYNVTALFCTLPTVNEIQVTTTEHDEPQDETYLVFKRDDVQQRFGVRLDGGMVNEAGWKQIKRDNLYKSGFIDRMVDAAEKAWK